MCPQAAIYVSLCFDICPQATICVLRLLYLCPQAHVRSIVPRIVRSARRLSRTRANTCDCSLSEAQRRIGWGQRGFEGGCGAAIERTHTTIYVSSYYHMCVLILLGKCPHNTIYVSSYYYLCPHTTIYVSSYHSYHSTGRTRMPKSVQRDSVTQAQCVCVCVTVCVLIQS